MPAGHVLWIGRSLGLKCKLELAKSGATRIWFFSAATNLMILMASCLKMQPGDEIAKQSCLELHVECSPGFSGCMLHACDLCYRHPMSFKCRLHAFVALVVPLNFREGFYPISQPGFSSQCLLSIQPIPNYTHIHIYIYICLYIII